jgi:hypothetical protein
MTENLLNTPIKDLTQEQLMQAITLRDQKNQKIWKENREYGPINIGGVHVISDDLGIKGVRNPNDGKFYDSKSQYYKSLKAQGCFITGNEEPPKERKQRGDFDCRKELAQAIDETGFMEKINGKG